MNNIIEPLRMSSILELQARAMYIKEMPGALCSWDELHDHHPDKIRLRDNAIACNQVLLDADWPEYKENTYMKLGEEQREVEQSRHENRVVMGRAALREILKDEIKK